MAIIRQISQPDLLFTIKTSLKKAIIFTWALLFFQSYLHTKWLEVNTDHFITYTQQNEKTITKVVKRLERFHSLLNYVFNRHIFEKGSYSKTINTLSPLLSTSHNQKLRDWTADLLAKAHKKINS